MENLPQAGAVTLDAIYAAAAVLVPHIRRTPLLHSEALSDATGYEVWLKAENLQRTGSFKVRGALAKIARLSADERRRGLVAASAGNHAQGVAFAAQQYGVACTIVMPETAPLTKITATRRLGAEVLLSGQTYDEAYTYAVRLAEQRGAVFVHPFDDPQVIAGQGTLGLEILEQMPDLEAVLVPVGGGGLIAGIATVLDALKPDVRLLGVQASGAAAFAPSLAAGRPVELARATTIADGIRVLRPGDLTVQLCRGRVHEVLEVPDEDIADAIVQLLEREKLVVEGAGAVGVAALLSGRVRLRPGARVVAILSGGNIDINLVARIIEHGLTKAGRYLVVRTVVDDRPGQLLRLLEPLAAMRVNIISIEHHRAGTRVPVDQSLVTLHLETRDPEHCREIIAALQARGYDVSVQ